MGILSSLMAGLHSVAKGVDEAAEHMGMPPVFRAATGSLAEMTGRAAASMEEGLAHGHGAAQGENHFFAGLKEKIFGHHEPEVAAPTEKLGRNAHHYSGVVTNPLAETAHVDPHAVDIHQIGHFAAPAVGTALRTGGVSMQA